MFEIFVKGRFKSILNISLQEIEIDGYPRDLPDSGYLTTIEHLAQKNNNSINIAVWKHTDDECLLVPTNPWDSELIDA